MIRNRNINSFTILATLLGTIIGAGFLGIPYVIMKSGFPIGAIHLFVVAALMLITTLYLGEIALRTKTNHQLPGYAEKYLGKHGKTLMFFAAAFGIFAALLAYLIAEGESLSAIFFGSSAYAIPMSFIFWFLLSLLSYFGIKALKKGETISIIFMIVLVLSICIMLSDKIQLSNLAYVEIENFFLPIGVILFAFLGFTAIPEMRLMTREKEWLLKPTIIKAYVFTFVIYLLFTFFVLGFKGKSTPQIVTIALGTPFILLGIITMFSAYLALSNSVIDTLRFDYNKTKTRAWLITVSLPMFLFIAVQLFNKATFTQILGLGGVISGGLTAILILLMVNKAKLHGDRKPEYSMPLPSLLKDILIILFVLGAFMEVLHLLQ